MSKLDLHNLYMLGKFAAMAQYPTSLEITEFGIRITVRERESGGGSGTRNGEVVHHLARWEHLELGQPVDQIVILIRDLNEAMRGWHRAGKPRPIEMAGRTRSA